MKTPANPAVSSSEAGIRPRSSRFRALILLSCPSSSVDQAARVRLRAQVVVEQRRAAIRGQLRRRNAGDVERLVQLDAGGQVVRQAAVDVTIPCWFVPMKYSWRLARYAAAADQREHDQRRQQGRERLDVAPLAASAVGRRPRAPLGPRQPGTRQPGRRRAAAVSRRSRRPSVRRRRRSDRRRAARPTIVGGIDRRRPRRPPRPGTGRR